MLSTTHTTHHFKKKQSNTQNVIPEIASGCLWHLYPRRNMLESPSWQLFKIGFFANRGQMLEEENNTCQIFFEFLLKLLYSKTSWEAVSWKKKTQMADLIRRGATLVRFLLSTKCTCASMSEESKCFGKRSTSRFRSNSSNFRNCWFVYPNKFPSFCSHLDQEDNPKTLHCLADEQSMIHQHHTFCTLQGDPPCLQLSKNDHGHTWFLPWSASTVEQSGVQKMSIQSVGGLFHLNQHSQAFGWVLGSTYIAIPKVEFMNVECFTGQFSFCLSNASWRICLKQIAPVVHVPKGQPKSMEIVDGWATVS